MDLEVDPETDEEAVVITVGVAMSVDEVLRRKRDYTRQWVGSVPAGIRPHIRLLYDNRASRTIAG